MSGKLSWICGNTLKRLSSHNESKCVNVEHISTSPLLSILCRNSLFPAGVLAANRHVALLCPVSTSCFCSCWLPCRSDSPRLPTTPNTRATTRSHGREHRTSRNKTAHGTGNKSLTEPLLRHHHPLKIPLSGRSDLPGSSFCSQCHHPSGNIWP